MKQVLKHIWSWEKKEDLEEKYIKSKETKLTLELKPQAFKENS